MPKTFLSPILEKVLGTADGIVLPPMAKWDEISATIARVKLGQLGAPWAPGMAEAVESWTSGKYNVDLSAGGQIRLGVSAALMLKHGDKFAPVLSQFDATHPTRPLQLTPPAGILESRNILQDVYGELGQEIIITCPSQDTVGFWAKDEAEDQDLIEEAWVEEYAKAHNLQVDYDLIIPVHRVISAPFTDSLIDFMFGEPGNWEQLIAGWPAYEFDTGSIEIMVPMIAELPESVVLEDGEILPNGRYRGSKVIPMFLTNKAEVIMQNILNCKK